MIKKILVSQPRPATEKSPYFDMEREYGVQVDFRQLIKVEGLSPKEFRAQHINLLDYTAILFSSRGSIDHFFHLAEELRVNIPEGMHYYCISEQVGVYLQKYIQYRKRRVFFGENNKFDDVVPAMLRRPQEKYLMICSDVHNDAVVNMFASHGIKVDTAVMYRTVPQEIPAEELQSYDIVVLFTPTGVQALKQNCPDYLSDGRAIACFGAATKKAIEELGWEAAIAAPTPECTSITTALDKYLKTHK